MSFLRTEKKLSQYSLKYNKDNFFEKFISEKMTSFGFKEGQL